MDVQSTSTGTKNEVVQFLAYSFQLLYSIHRQGRHSQKPSCHANKIDENINKFSES